MLRIWSSVFIAILCITLSGCFSSSESDPIDGNSTTSSSANTSSEEPEVLLEHFNAPPLEELEAKVTWVDQPVLDMIDHLSEKLVKEKPLTDVKTALTLRNDYPKSKENNEKIKSTLGRLPENGEEADYNATITRHVVGDVKSSNPILMSSSTEFDIASLLGIELFTFDWNMIACADANYVKSWQTSKDSMYDKIVLRDDLYWEDGKPITAHDIVFTFKTIMDSRITIPAVRHGVDKIRWIEAYDDHTYVIFHKEANPVNIWNINFPTIPKHAYEHTIDADTTLTTSDEHRELENRPIAGGPYRLSKRIFNQEIVLERREGFHTVNGKQVRKKPFFKTIRFRIIEDPNTAIVALKSGEIDEMAISADHWETQANDDDFYKLNTKATATEWVSFHFNWNCKTPLFSDPKVRRAMSYAFDHDEMLNKLFKGLYSPSNGPFHPTSWMAPKGDRQPAYFTQDLDKAEELLDEAGWEDSDLDGIRDKKINGKKVNFEFTILSSQVPNSIKVCTLLKESLDKIGIICHVKPTEATVLQDMQLKKKFQAAFGGWGTGTDPYTNENIFGTGKNRNYGSYSNPKVDELFLQGLKEFDREKRTAIYAQIHELLYEDQPYTWLFYRNSFYGFNKKLRGYQFSPRGPYHYSPGFNSIWAASSP